MKSLFRTLFRAAKNVIWAVVTLVIFVAFINITTPPSSWATASTIQILGFFLSLLLFMTFFWHIFIKQFAISFLLALGIMMILVLQAIKELNYVTAFGTLVLTILLSLLYNKLRRQQFNFRIPFIKRSESKKETDE